MLPSGYENYKVPTPINEDYVSIRDERYPYDSWNPLRDGRFSTPDRPAYYCGSGLDVAKHEKYGDPTVDVADGHAVCRPPTGTYVLFDLMGYLSDHPEVHDIYYGGPDKGYGECQQLSEELAVAGVSGVKYGSAPHSGGVNFAVWEVDGTPFPKRYFTPTAAGDTPQGEDS